MTKTDEQTKAMWEEWARQLRGRIDREQNLKYSPQDPVTVVLTCKNRESVLPLVIPSLGKQTHQPDLVVLSDDASTDRSVPTFTSLCREFRLEHRVASLPPGLAYRINTVRNNGFEGALDGLVILLDSDLMVGRAFIECHRRMHLETSVPCGSYGPRLESANPDGSGPVHYKWGYEALAQVSPVRGASLPSWVTLLGCNMGVTKKVWDLIGRFDEQYDGNRGADDQDFHYRLHRAGIRALGEFDAYVIHLPHSDFIENRREINLRKFREKYGFELYEGSHVPQELLNLSWGYGDWSKIVGRLQRGDPEAGMTRGLDRLFRTRLKRIYEGSRIKRFYRAMEAFLRWGWAR